MKMENKLYILHILREIIKHSWCACKRAFVILVLCSAMQSLLYIFEIYMMQFLFDAVTELGLGKIHLSEVYQILVFTFVVLCSHPIINAIYDLAQGYFWRRSNGYLQYLFHKKVSELDLIDFEVSTTYEEMKKAILANDEAPDACRTLLRLITYCIPVCIYLGIYLFSVKPILVFVLGIIFISVYLSEIFRAKTMYALENEIVKIKRRMEHFEDCITKTEFLKETRILDAISYFYSLYKRNIEKYNSQTLKMEKANARRDGILNGINVVGYLGILGLLVYYLRLGEITVGSFAAIFYSVEKLSNMMKNMINNIGSIYKEITLSSFLISFLEKRKPEKKIDYLDKKKDILLENVSFTYPGRDIAAIKNINCRIKAGNTIAIVGANGAGKTTLSRLLMGLYQPTEGKISFGNNDISKFSRKSVFQNVSAVFQKFQKYKLSCRRNIQISELNHSKEIEFALTQAGVSLKKINHDVDTVLSKEFDGIELSGGEWQRIAIARGLYRNSDIIVLDEPTAAIDPIEEEKMYNTFMKAAKNRTAILITHRISSTQIADDILVLNEGRIEEFGSHEELLRNKGLYYQMYTEQARWYIR